MKKFSYLILIFGVGCIGTDFEPPVDPVLRLGEAPATLYESQTFQMAFQYFDHRGIEVDTTITWSSSNDEIASVDENGLIVSHSEGIVTISGSIGELQNSAEIIVNASLESINIIQSTDTILVGESSRFRAEYFQFDGTEVLDSDQVSWSSRDENIALVTSNGTVRGMSVGTTYIISSGESAKDSMQVRIVENTADLPREILITASRSQLSVGESFQFVAMVFDESGREITTANVTWSSANSSIISTTERGLAMGVAEGTTNILASFEGLEAQVEVMVIADEQEMQEEETSTTRTGTLSGRGGYDISGEFQLTVNSAGGIILTLSNPSIDPSAPGPYYYLSNQENAVSGGINLGKADNDVLSIDITSEFPDTTIDQFDFLVVWCEPFSLTLGAGQFDN